MSKTSFNSFVTEDDKSTESSVDLVTSYLEKSLGKIYRLPGLEKFKNKHGSGTGIRLFAGKKSFRLNLSGRNLVSVDIWNGSSKDPNYHLDLTGWTKKIAQIAPKIADLIMRPKLGKHAVTEAFVNALSEAAMATHEEAYDKLIKFLAARKDEGDSFVIGDLNRLNMGARAQQVFFAMLEVPGAIKQDRSGSKTTYTVVDLDKINKRSLLKDTFKVEVKGDIIIINGSGETIIDSSGIKAPPSYEQQLKDLEQILTGVVKKNLSNGVFIAGRGGVGKTHTVEKVLKDLGLRDDVDYFKTTTTASPSAMYQALFDHRDGVIVFDDADNALDDDEGRNLIKAATDTKKVRKLSWTKQSNWTYDPLKPPSDAPSKQIWLLNMQKKGMFPRAYEFTGKIIFISNKSLDKLDPDKALRTRAFVINLDPSNDEIIAYMRKIADTIKLDDGQLSSKDRQEVIDEIANGDAEDISIRKLVRGLNIRGAGIPNWRELINRYA